MGYGWDNEVRDRYIYLLAFAAKRQVYVGQSVDPIRRIKSHRRPSGGWADPFLPLVVHREPCTEAEIMDFEYAWRWNVHLHGWTPITLNDLPFDMGLLRPSAKERGGALPWPFTI